MQEFTEFINQLPNMAGIFMLMLSTFLIGYFSSLWMQKDASRKLINRLKGEVNALKTRPHVNDIDTIFTEIKPKIVAVVKETQEAIQDKAVIAERNAAKVNNSIITYNKQKPALNYDSFGTAIRSERDDLTKINGIGPYIEEKLNEIDIYTFKQLSNLKESDIRVVTELIDFFPGRIERDDWVGQARALIQVN